MTFQRPALPRETRRTLRSLGWRYRPLLAAALVAIAAWAALGIARPAPPPGVAVVVATRDLQPGHLLGGGDVTTLTLPDDVAPDAALTLPASAVGHRVAHTVTAGVPLTASALVTDGVWPGVREGELVVPVRLADPAVAGLLPPATPLHLVSATGSGPTLLTAHGRLLAAVPDAGGGSGGSMLGAPDAAGTLLLLAVPQEVASLVLDASAGGTLTVALSPSPHPQESP